VSVPIFKTIQWVCDVFILIDTVIEEDVLYVNNMHNLIEIHLVSALHPCEAGRVASAQYILFGYYTTTKNFIACLESMNGKSNASSQKHITIN
jgi:hypothetical protein